MPDSNPATNPATEMPTDQMLAATENILQDLKTKAIAMEALHSKTSLAAPSHVLCDSQDAFATVHAMIEVFNRQITAIEELQRIHKTWDPGTQHDYMNPYPNRK